MRKSIPLPTVKLKATIIFPALLLCLTAAGQQLRFEAASFDFGLIREDGGMVSHTFRYTNAGNRAVVIEYIDTSCGCTTTDFTRKPVKPGEQGAVTVTYDPMNRPGPFSKTLTVSANNATVKATLSITGEVKARIRPTEEQYPIELTGKVRTDILAAYLRNVAMGSARSTAIGLVNTSDRAITLGFKVVPACHLLKIHAPGTLAPGERATVTLTLDMTGQKTAWGLYQAQVYYIFDGEMCKTPISMVAYGVDDFTGIDPNDAPRARLSAQFHDFGDTEPSQGVKKAGFTLQNTGAKPMTVRSVDAGQALGTNLRPGTVIAPGGKLAFDVWIDPAKAPQGIFAETVTLIVNDPLRPVRELRTAAYIR